MLPFEIGRACGAELDEHCRRVATLASRTARVLKLPPALVWALELAAEMHHAWGPRLAGPGEAVRSEPPTVAGASSATLLLAHAILRAAAERGPADEQIGVAAEVLTACNTLDEAAEFAALEGTSLREALTDFTETWLSLCSRPVATVLRGMIAPWPVDIAAARLPVLPRAASDLIRTPEENISPAQLAKLASSDPVLAGRLLGVANSSFYGGAAPILRFTDAVLRVGVPVARKAMISAAFSGLFASPVLRELWRHSQAAAAAAHELAEMAAFDPDAAWLGGLLHDIGRLALETQSAPSRIAEAEWRKGGMPGDYAETLTYGQDHAKLGAHLLRQWGLPEEIAEAVEMHHRPERSGSSLAATLALAEEWCVARIGSEALSWELRHLAACRNVGLEPDVLDRLNNGSVLFALAG